MVLAGPADIPEGAADSVYCETCPRVTVPAVREGTEVAWPAGGASNRSRRFASRRRRSRSLKSPRARRMPAGGFFTVIVGRQQRRPGVPALSARVARRGIRWVSRGRRASQLR